MGFWSSFTGAISDEAHNVAAGAYALTNHPIDTISTITGISPNANPLSPGPTPIEQDLPQTAQTAVDNLSKGIASGTKNAATALSLTPILILVAVSAAVYFLVIKPGSRSGYLK